MSIRYPVTSLLLRIVVDVFNNLPGSPNPYSTLNSQDVALPNNVPPISFGNARLFEPGARVAFGVGLDREPARLHRPNATCADPDNIQIVATVNACLRVDDNRVMRVNISVVVIKVCVNDRA